MLTVDSLSRLIGIPLVPWQAHYEHAAVTGRQERYPASLFSAAFVRDYATTMRPYLLFVSGMAGLVGVALAPAVPWHEALVIGAAFFLSYGFGQALTDCFQLDTDSRSAPYRPLVRGTIRRRDVLGVSLIGLSISGGILMAFNPWNAALAILAVVGLATYTPFKRRWWAGPFYNAWIVALLPLMGFLAAAGTDPLRALAHPPLQWTMIVTFFAYSNFVLVGYFKDISADRATGYRTLPVSAGLGISSFVSDVFALLAVGGAWALAWLGGLGGSGADHLRAIAGQMEWTFPSLAAVAILVAGTASSIVAQVNAHRVRHEGEAFKAIEPVLYAHILLLAGIAALYKPFWVPFFVAYGALFALVLWTRPDPAQV